MSNVYLPTAKIAAAGYLPAAGLAAAVGMAAALLATLLPAAEATRVEPSPAMRPGSIEVVRVRRLRGRAAGAVFLIVLAAAASRARAVDGFPFFGFAAVVLVVAALAAAAPIARSPRLPRRGPAARPVLRRPGRLAVEFFGGSLARHAIAVASLAMALGMTLAMIVTVSSIRETVRVWVETTLRSDLWVKAEAGGRRGLVGDLPRRDRARSSARSRASPRLIPFRARDASDERGRPFTLASGDFRVVARIGGLPLLDGRDVTDVALEAREKGEVLVSEPFARRYGVGVGDHVPAFDAAGGSRRRESPASIAITPTTAGPSCSTGRPSSRCTATRV